MDRQIPRAEAALEKTENPLDIIQEALEGARTGVWMIENEEGHAARMYADKTMRMLIGVNDDVTPEECYDAWYSRIDTEYLGMVQEAVSDMVNNKTRSEVVYPWHHPTLGRIYVRCGGVLDASFTKPGFRLRGYHQDITETMVTRKEQEKALLEALNEAKRANAAKTEFLSHMSHDIRTPINGILGMLTISEKNQGNSVKQQECREKIRIAANHLLSLINDVLDISKLESGSFAYSAEIFDARTTLESSMDILRPQAEEQGICLRLRHLHLEHRWYVGSPLHVRQIFMNIVTNAIKYNKPCGKVFIDVEEVPADDSHILCCLTVEDTGIGMSEEFMKHLFEPFTQEHGSARTNYQGTGLGMAITKGLVDQMHGKIFVESHVGEGSTFRVELPMEFTDGGDMEAKEKAEAVTPDISGMKILLVEDNEMNREISQYFLEESGAVVVNAEDGAKAVQAFSESAVGELDCILMDVMMPVMDGLEAARTIRAMNRKDAAEIPIIALSANAFAEDVQMARDAGMNAHLAKPLNVNDMLVTLSLLRNK